MSFLSAEKRRLLAQRLKEKGLHSAHLEGGRAIPQRTGEEAPPLSFAQQRLWVLDRLEPGNPFYNITNAAEFVGRLDPAALARAFGEIVRRHEVLRTTFPEVDDAPVQAVAPPPAGPWPLPLVDLSGLPDPLREAERLALEEARRPFDLERGPLLRTTLMLLEPGRHALLASLHHIISDGWSHGVFLREMMALYAGEPLPELPIQYADFAAWQREWLAGEVLESQLGFWRERLRGSPPALDLPTDRPRPPVQGYRGARQPLRLPSRLTEALHELGRAEGATLFMTLLAAFGVLLRAHAGAEDLPVGTPVANRRRVEVEGLIGFFVNTLVLRLDLSGEPSFRELIGRARDTAREGFEHQDLPFERLVEELQPERDLGRAPLFQVMFVLQNAPIPDLRVPGLAVHRLELDPGVARFDLMLDLMEREGGVQGDLEYATDLFDPPTMARMADHLLRFLESAAADPDRPAGALSMLGEAERHQLLIEWADGEWAAAPEISVAGPPDALAVIGTDGTALTYRELLERSRRLAGWLRSRGIGPESRVGISLPRSTDLAVAVLGVLQAGAACVPIDPAYPEERRAFLREDSGAALVLEGALPEGEEGEAAPTPGNLAYVIYTSGSTGRPKGVAMPHAALANLVGWQLASLPGARRTAQFAPSSFDVFFQEVLSTWASGGTLVLLSEETRRDPVALWRYLAEQRVERLFLPFVALQQLAEAARSEARLPDTLREVITAGEQLQATPALRELFSRLGARLHNHYGPSETHVATAWELPPEAEGWPSLPPIGRPIGNARALVLDPRGNPAPIGAAGELFLGGAALARGYLDRPDATADRFVPDPFGGPGARLYRSGDLARFRPDGTLEFLGRADHQVKIRGFRIEPGEIEAALAAHPDVREAAVVVREDRAGDRRLVAYVGAERDPGAPALRAFLEGRLPEFMVPSAFVALPALPLTPSGKLDRRALPAPEPVAMEEYVPPRTPTEETVAAVFSEVLGVERVGAGSHFFELGGHSLLATRALSRLRAALGVEVPLRTLFEVPTVAGLAARLDAETRVGQEAAIARVGVRRAPLSFAQQRLWFIDRLEPGSPAYNLPIALRIVGDLDVSALARALAAMVERHESLRTTFAVEEGEPVQVVALEERIELPVVDLTGVPEREEEARRRALEHARRPFDLERGPLVRALLLRLGADEHQMVLTTHHIVSDGWSLGVVMVREVAALYEGEPLPPLPIQYADFAVWQRSWLQGEVLERQLAYWREELAGAPTVLELPADRPRPSLQSFRGARRELALSAGIVESLRALGRRQGATLFMVALAAFEALLQRLTGRDDLLVGTPVANRDRLDTEGLIGFFVNTLVLRGRLGGEPSFRDAVDRARASTLGALAHQDLPFERLVEELQPARDLSRSPLFQVMFTLDAALPASVQLPGGLTLAPINLDEGTAKFDLSLSLAEEGAHGALAGSVEYAVELFDAATAERFAEAFHVLVEAAAADPGAPVADLPLLGSAARHQLLREWSGAGIPSTATVLDLLAARDPGAIAIEGPAGAWTYGDLIRRAGRIAGRLAELGVGPEVRVGVFLERSPEALAALVGVLRAGGAFVPLSVSDPAERLAWLLADSGVPLVIASRGTVGALPSGGPRVILVEDLESGPERAPAIPHPGQSAYVIYTSGSTGRPKGVVVPHGAFGAYAVALGRRMALGPSDRVLQFHPLTFDISLEETFPVWAAGGTVVLDNPERMASVAEMARVLEEGRVTVLNQPTAFWVEWEGHLLRTGGRPPSCLRLVVVGGEAVPAATAEVWRDWGITLVNAYGLTETTATSTAHFLGEAGESGRPQLPIGRPLDNTTIYVVDRGFAPVPIGVPGEIVIGGASVGRGYLGRPDLTGERFVPDPFGLPGARLYRTGDLGRWNTGGGLDFLGRVDHQVKIRGFRVETDEVTAVLASHPDVRQAIVVARGQQLVAYVVADGDLSLVDWLRERLPDYMVPAFLVPLPALPLTASGKVDRKALPAPSAGSGRPRRAPRSPSEVVLADLWREILGIEEIGIDDDFFALGGHSLLATRVVSRLRGAFGVELPLRALFEAPTVAGLAARIEREAFLEGGEGAPPPLARSGERGPAPLSFSQRRLWFLDRLEPGSTAYNLSVAFRLEGPLDVAALERAMTELARRHESLRTVFALEGTEPVQVVLDPAPVPLSVVEAGDLQGMLEEEARRPFDLAQGPLLRVLLLRLGPKEHAVSVAMHHIVSDGWSMGVFVREAVALYSGEVLPKLMLQYPDYARWQRRWLEGEALAAQLRFWQEELEGVPTVLGVPGDRPRPPVQSFRGAQRTAPLPEPLGAGLRALARREGATLFMTLLAAFQAVLGRTAGQDDLLVGSPVANRHRVEVEDLIGFFVNTLVLRGDLRGDPSFREMLGRVHARSLAAWSHQDLPFERLVEELKIERSLSRNPLFQVMFTLEVPPPEMPSPAGLKLTPLAVDTGTAKADLLLGITDLGDRLAMTWEYATDLFDGVTIDRFAGRLTLLLEAVVAAPETRLSDLPLMGAEEREQVLGNWNDTASIYPRQACVHELFAEQAARTPEAVALELEDLTMTYRELDGRSDRLARRLRRLGVGPEVPVALSFGRAPDLIVALLGVLKAGGFYVPLDPAHPEERRAVVLRESAAALVLDSAEGEDGGPLESLAVPENLAYVMYTSGSTGVPKGVAVTHRNVVRLVRGTGYAGLGPEETFLQLAPVSFDASTFEIWGALLNGGRLVLFPGERASLDEIAGAIDRHGVTTLWLTAGLFHQMVDHRLEGLRPLRQLLAGGDTLAPARVRRVLEELPGLTLINGYGPTEGTTFTCCHPMRQLGESETLFGTVPIGRPIANTRAYVLDLWGQPAPPGVPGELCVGGDGLARGYLGRPDLTAESFIPFADGERLYRTGDLVRWLPDGAIEFLGRIDNQIKIRGFRVEPGEIEAVLAGHPEVRQAAVLVRDRELVAYVAGEGEDLPSRLQRYLSERLPDPMVPRAWVLLPALPLTPNGKVDRRTLSASAPVPGRAGSGTPYVAPRTPLETKLAEAWAEMLGIERVGLHDDFFQLGGHSLLATQLIAELERRWQIEVPLKTLFEATTLGELAERITERELERAGSEDLSVLLDEIDGLSPEELRALLAEEGSTR